MLNQAPVVFLIDVDNTLLDNDRFATDLSDLLVSHFGHDQSARFWAIYAGMRERLGYADYLGALQQFGDGHFDALAVSRVSAFMLDYPFDEHLYPGALALITHLHGIGLPVLFSDGDSVFQPRKIQRSGLGEAVDGQVMVCVHKERMLDLMQRRFPARHYVMIDDKPRLLAAVKRVLTDSLTTVFVCQGHYALAAAGEPLEPPNDLSVALIGDLCAFALSDFNAGTIASATTSTRNVALVPPPSELPEQT